MIQATLPAARASRWTYAALLVAASLVVLAFVRMALLGNAWRDSSFLAIMALPLGLAAWGCFAAAGRAIHPPTLQVERDKLVLRVGWKRRSWPWSEIEDFRIARTQRDTFVTFAWIQPDGARKGQWLNYPFTNDPDALLTNLQQALAAARRRGASVPRTFAPDPAFEERAARTRQRLAILTLIPFGLFALLIVDLNMAGSSLVTAIDPRLHSLFLCGGAGYGLMLAYLIAKVLRERTDRPVPDSFRRAAVVGTALLGVPMLMGMAHYWSWRVADIAAFAGSRATTQQSYYRILGFSQSKSSYWADFDPYFTGSRTSLRVSYADYRRLWAAYEPNRTSIYCFPLLTQRRGDAVRIMMPQRPGPGDLVLVRCPPKADPIPFD